MEGSSLTTEFKFFSSNGIGFEVFWGVFFGVCIF